MFMKLTGKQCLVVGAGKVGEPKIGGLIDTGARIHVVAIAASGTVREWADAGKVELELRAFSAGDLDGKFLAVVATASNSLNELIYREPQWRGAATYRSRFQPPGRVRRWRRNFGSNWNGSSEPDTRRGLSSSARPDDSFCPAISIKRPNGSYCTHWRAGKPSKRSWPKSRR